MENAILNVNGMSCEHCVRAVNKAVGALPGVSGVSVDLKAKTVAVAYEPGKTSLDAIRGAIEDQGYDVV